MSEARTIWHVMESRRTTEVSRRRAGLLLVVLMLCVVAAAEVLFLNVVAAPGSVEMIQQAEGIALPP